MDDWEAKPNIPAREYDAQGFREISAMPSNGFNGMTELKRGDRTVQMTGTGPAIRKALVMHMANAKR